MIKDKKISITNNLDNLKYSGTVTVTLKHGQKVISKNTYKNNGSERLFQYLCFCLAGRWSEAVDERPAKIKLYYNSTSNPDSIDTKHPFNNTDSLTRLVNKNSKITVVPIYNENNTNDILTYTAVLHFIIPSSYLSSSNSDNAEINQIGLFPSRYTSAEGDSIEEDNNNWLAYFLFRDPNEDRWNVNNIKLRTLSGNFNLIIEWQMSFTN